MKMTREQLEALVILQEIQTAMARQKLKLTDLISKIEGQERFLYQEETDVRNASEELLNIIENFESRIRSADINYLNR